LVIKWGVLGEAILRRNIKNKTYNEWQFEIIENNRFLKLTHQSGFITRILFIHHPSWRFYNSVNSRKKIYDSFPELNNLIP